MDDDFDYDRFDDDGRGSDQGHPMQRPRAAARRPRSRGLILGFGVIGVVALAAFVAWAYFAGDDYLAKDELPVVSADRTPYKVRPEEPGGMEVPNQDKEVYERVGENAEESDKVERLMPPAEEAEPPAQTAGQEATAAVQEMAGKAMSEGASAGDSLTPPPPPPVETVAKETAQAAGETAGKMADQAAGAATQTAADSETAQVSREELPPPPGAKTEESAPAAPAAPAADAGSGTQTETPATAPATAPAASSAPAAGGDYRVQVAAIRDRSKAESSWAAIQKRHEDVLGGLALTVVEVELEGRGTFFRLQGGGVSRARAEEICAALKQRDAGCLVVRP